MVLAVLGSAVGALAVVGLALLASLLLARLLRHVVPPGFWLPGDILPCQEVLTARPRAVRDRARHPPYDLRRPQDTIDDDIDEQERPCAPP
jgi:hypothetical protein